MVAQLQLMLIFIGAATQRCTSITPIMFTVRFCKLEVWTRIFWSVHTVKQSCWDGRRTGRGCGNQKWKRRRACFDWQLSGLLPAEVVPPVDCYYQQKEFPIALAGTVSPLSPGGCYPIWEEMNRGPPAPYEVSVDRIFTEEVQWSKQA